MPSFLYFQSLVQYRIPVNTDGTLGNPEITRKFTTAVKGAQGFNKAKKKTINLETEQAESIEI